jgi:hypothetical protein
MSDMVLSTSLDQSFSTENQALIEWIKEKAEESINKKDVDIIMNVFESLVKVTKMNGLALACGLYIVNANWSAFGIDDNFEDFVFVKLGIHNHTVDRYLDVWSMYETKAVPETIAPAIMQQNIKAQIPIAKAIAQGYTIDADTWEELADAVDYTEVSRIIREDVKHTNPRKGSMQLYMDRDGSVKAVNNGEFFDIGYLNVFSEDEVVLKAIERIVSNSGILRR